MSMEINVAGNSDSLFEEIKKLASSQIWTVQEEVESLTRLIASCGRLSFSPPEGMFIIYVPSKVFGRPRCRAMKVTLFLKGSDLAIKLHGKHDGIVTTWPAIREDVGGIGQALLLIEQYDGGRISGSVYSRTEALNKIYAKIPHPAPPPVPPTELELLEKLRAAETELEECKLTLAKLKTGVNRIQRRLKKVQRLGPMSHEEIAEECRSMKTAFKTDCESTPKEDD